MLGIQQAAYVWSIVRERHRGSLEEAAAATRFKMIRLLCGNKNLAVFLSYSGGGCRLLRGAAVWVDPLQRSRSLSEVVRRGLSSERPRLPFCV